LAIYVTAATAAISVRHAGIEHSFSSKIE